jgi:hypothetical protein
MNTLTAYVKYILCKPGKIILRKGGVENQGPSSDVIFTTVLIISLSLHNSYRED